MYRTAGYRVIDLGTLSAQTRQAIQPIPVHPRKKLVNQIAAAFGYCRLLATIDGAK